MNSPSRLSESLLQEHSSIAQLPPDDVLACPICTQQDWEHVRKIRGAWISKCVHCELLVTTNFLRKVHTPHSLYETSKEHHLIYRQQYMRRRRPMYERIMPHLEPFRNSGRLLEIGCSYGYFLEVARQAGWRAEGVEISGYASGVARSKGFRIHQAELRNLELDRGSYDVIAMWDVIEHLVNPADVVERCAELLLPGGAFVARTPNAHALETAGSLFALAYRQLVYPANTPEHVFHFTPETLSTLLQKSGFGRVRTDNYGGWEERIISGRNAAVRTGRYLVMRYAFYRQWPYEFVITGIKPNSICEASCPQAR